MKKHPFTESEKHHFIQFMLESNVLCFGKFTTKKGRKTPYFINTGLYYTALQIKTLSEFYAKMIDYYFGHTAKNTVSNLFGPAYKGIPLATATAVELQNNYNLNLSISFNRKELKNHGESGIIVGNSYKEQSENIVIVEDVITAGTSVKEIFPLLQSTTKNTVLGLVVSVDRQEKGNGEQSALQELQELFQIECHSIVTIQDIISFLENNQRVSLTQLEEIKQYRSQYAHSP